MRDLLTDRKSSILGVWAAPGGRETLQKGGGVKPLTLLEGFPAARGRPDNRNLRSPVGQKIMYKEPKCKMGLRG